MGYEMFDTVGAVCFGLWIGSFFGARVANNGWALRSKPGDRKFYKGKFYIITREDS